jgi:hypothetical protein
MLKVKKLKNLKKIAIIALIALISYFIIAKPVFIGPYLLRNNHRFTIGEIVRTQEVAEGNLSMPSHHDFNVGEKYFIMFYEKDPGILKS